jgi:large subunit ribosomal protein L6
MSRIAKAPINLPKGTDITINGQHVAVKGGKGSLELNVHELAKVSVDGDVVTVTPAEESKPAWAMAGTMRSLVNNMVVGCSEGFTKKLQLIGVGYRAQAKGNTLSLNLGFSHPVDYPVPAGITVETPSQTEIVVTGSDKQVVGQVASEIRAYRPPEPYKGKGVRYADEHVVRKEAKKK